MKLIYATLGLLLFFALLGLALKNMQVVELRYYLGRIWHAPLSLMLLLSMIAGVVLGVIACIKPLTNMRKQSIALKRELNELNKHMSAKPTEVK